jgi:hypothetical protein
MDKQEKNQVKNTVFRISGANKVKRTQIFITNFNKYKYPTLILIHFQNSKLNIRLINRAFSDSAI